MGKIDETGGKKQFLKNFCTNPLQLCIFVVGRYNVQEKLHNNRHGLRTGASTILCNPSKSETR